MSGIDVFGRNVDYYAHYDEINGISSASPILIQGVKVGKVTDIILDPTSSDKVVLKFSIKRRYEIPADSEAKIYSPGLMSSMAIGINLGQSSTMLSAGDTINSIASENIMDVATTKLLDVADQVTTIGSQLEDTLSQINTILEGSSQSIEATISNLDSISGDIAEILEQKGEAISGTIDAISSFSLSLSGNTEKIDHIVDNLERLSLELSQADISNSLSATLSELNTTLESVNSAEGSAGKLLQDELLYDNLAAVSGSLNDLIVDMQHNPKRYVHFSLFGSKSKE